MRDLPRYHVFFESDEVSVRFEVVCDYGDEIDTVRRYLSRPCPDAEEPAGVKIARSVIRNGVRHQYQIDRIGTGEGEGIIAVDVLRCTSGLA